MEDIAMGKKCLCCLDPIDDKPTVVKLMECTHEICLECYNRWKRLKETCPLCRRQIITIRQTTIDRTKSCDEEGGWNHSSNYNIGYCTSFEEEFQFSKDKVTEEDMDLACLDHAYFNEELQKLTRLIFDVKRERFEVRGAKGTDHEWSVLEQIEIQLDNMWILNDQLVQFDIKDRLTEVYNMAETLFKIKFGKLTDDFIPVTDDMYEYTDFDNYQEEYYEDEPLDYDSVPWDYYEDEAAFTKKIKPFRLKANKK